MPKQSQPRKGKHKKKPSRTRQPQRSQTIPVTPKTWYGVLGVSSQADSEAIRQHYVDLVHQFPPETHPDQFEIIRQAYEVLSDEKARHRYDRERFYGTTVAKLKALIEQRTEQGRWEEVARLLTQMVDIEPSWEDMAKLAAVYTALGRPREAEKWYQQALVATDSAEAELSIEIGLAHVAGSPQAIVTRLQDIAQRHPDVFSSELGREFLDHCEAVGDMDPGMEYFRKFIPQREPLTADDFEFYLEWMDMLGELGHGDLLKELVLNHVKPAVEHAAEGPNRSEIAQRCVRYVDGIETENVTQWQVRAMVAHFAHLLEPDDSMIHDRWRESVEDYRMVSEVDRLMNDERVPWLVLDRVFEALSLVEDDWRDDDFDLIQDSLDTPRTLPEVEAIALIRQRYPNLASLLDAISPSVLTVRGDVDEAQ